MSEATELAAETLHLQRTARIVGDPRILIIDDEDAIRESLDTLLTLEGFTVSAAIDGPPGLNPCQRTSTIFSSSTSLSPVRAASIFYLASLRCSPTFPSS